MNDRPAALEADLRYQLARIEEARRDVIAETRQTMGLELAEVRREIENFRRQMARGNVGSTATVHEQFLAEARDLLTRPRRRCRCAGGTARGNAQRTGGTRGGQ